MFHKRPSLAIASDSVQSFTAKASEEVLHCFLSGFQSLSDFSCPLTFPQLVFDHFSDRTFVRFWNFSEEEFPTQNMKRLYNGPSECIDGFLLVILGGISIIRRVNSTASTNENRIVKQFRRVAEIDMKSINSFPGTRREISRKSF
jgi:hypothetical protein